jgi:hypothetical protein
MTINRFVLLWFFLLLIFSGCSDVKVDDRDSILRNLREVRVTVSVPQGPESLSLQLQNTLESRLRDAGLKISPRAQVEIQLKVMWGMMKGMTYISVRFNDSAVYAADMASDEHSDLLARTPQFVSEFTDAFLNKWTEVNATSKRPRD